MAMAAAQLNITRGEAVRFHVVGDPQPLLRRKKTTMMPITLVASLEPWLNDTQLEDSICMRL